MENPLRAIETTGSVENHRRLLLDKPVPIGEGVKVRVIILTSEEVHRKRPRQPEEEDEWLRAAATNPAFDFLKEPDEDIYTLQDGRPFHDAG